MLAGWHLKIFDLLTFKLKDISHAEEHEREKKLLCVVDLLVMLPSVILLPLSILFLFLYVLCFHSTNAFFRLVKVSSLSLPPHADAKVGAGKKGGISLGIQQRLLVSWLPRKRRRGVEEKRS